MTRNGILDVVRKHLARSVDGITPDEIDPMRSMKDYGANSLDLVEIVSASMRELKVKVPRSELSSITNMDGLVEILFRVWTEKNTKTAAG